VPEAVATPAGESQELRGGSVARSTVVFAALTALSRLTALVREVLVARYFGVAGAMSAYTIAFQLPNLVRALVSDSALQGAFVPVFTELLEQGRRREAFRVAWTTAFLIVIGLGLLTGTVALLADTLAPVLSPGFGDSPALRDLTAGLTRVMFPTVIFFSLAGLVAAMLNSFDEFAAPVGGQIAFNLASVVGLVTLVPPLSGDSRIYAFAAATLAAKA
jgi:putative peptidoglycan lipid II flippase